MKLLGWEISRAKTDVEKSVGTVNAEGTARIQGIAASYASPLGTATPATGNRPTPGALPDESADADPLRFQYTYGTNLTYTPRGGYNLTPFATLRAIASTSSEVYACIQTRKDQVASLTWDFAPKDKKQKDENAFKEKIDAARAFFAKPDKITPFASWLQMLIDEVLTIDALSIYKRRTRGGGLYGYEIIDGSTIKPLLDVNGKMPLPPDVAYRQIIYGAPVVGGDMTADELMYLPKNPRVWTPYGMSPTEAVLLIVSSAINRQMYHLSYYSQGNIPEALVGVPDTWSPKQIRQFSDYWNALLRGDPKNRSGLRFVTETMANSVHEFRDADFTTGWELWLLKVICACFAVTPSEIGFTDDVNKAVSKTQGEVGQRRGIKPLANFIKGILDTMIATDLKMPDMECVWNGGEGENALVAAQVREIQLRTGEKSLDEVRAANGDPVLGVGPAIITATGPVFWEDAVKAAQTDTKPPTNGAAPAAAGAQPKDDSQAQADLQKYYRVASKAVTEGRKVKAFRSEAASPRVLADLAAKLATASTPTEVDAIFAPVLKAQVLSKTQRKNRDAMKTKVTGVLSAMRKDFIAHMASAMTEEK